MDPRVIEIVNRLEEVSDTAARMVHDGVAASLRPEWEDDDRADLDLARSAAEDIRAWGETVLRELDAIAGGTAPPPRPSSPPQSRHACSHRHEVTPCPPRAHPSGQHGSTS